MSGKTQDPRTDISRLLAGEDFRFERDDAYIVGPNGSRVIPGVRLYLRNAGGRWAKASWLVANKENGPETILNALRSWVGAIEGVSDEATA